MLGQYGYQGDIILQSSKQAWFLLVEWGMISYTNKERKNRTQS